MLDNAVRSKFLMRVRDWTSVTADVFVAWACCKNAWVRRTLTTYLHWKSASVQNSKHVDPHAGQMRKHSYSNVPGHWYFRIAYLSESNFCSLSILTQLSDSQRTQNQNAVARESRITRFFHGIDTLARMASLPTAAEREFDEELDRKILIWLIRAFMEPRWNRKR